MTSQSPMRVEFICRGSRRDGLGHIMRTRAVAAVMARRADVHLSVLGDDSVHALLQHTGLAYRVFSEEGRLGAHLKSKPADLYVFDTMHIEQAVFDLAKRTGPTASLSPIFTHLPDVDVLYNRTRYGGADWGAWPKPPRMCMGLDYAVIRDTCVRIPDELYRDNVQHDILSLAVSMGGGDAGNRTLRVLEALRAAPARLLVWVLLGEGYSHAYEPLVECIRRDRRHEIILVKATDSMWRIMRACALAILAGGTVTYEAAFAGLPSINLFDNPDHEFLIRELVERGCCRSAGAPFDAAIKAAVGLVNQLERNRDALERMHKACHGVMDGRAVERIVEDLMTVARGRARVTA